ncbi:threonine/homoserine/homoserine lactone efflux protein [Motilibacter peucedani]|uniref:Threonine/homoserine/homoserine lactone efflux protein n=1 Tax=Motilibacter peucedani TaxID=598650 RepID=A0A420XT01_9ACTN|nr:LysE family translocator [Motilibacter peucedani]RKS77869.1 threonine/homoserine/homoserine lactone efflux protein [Motilibacter peucedani]
MVGRGSVLGVAAVALGMVLTPGPNMMYLVSRSVSQGRRAGFVSLGGVAVGFLAYLAAASFGLSAVFSAVPELYVSVKLAGAAYLAWLAWKAVRPGGVSVFAPLELTPDSPRRLFVMGLTTNLLNPKAALMYASLIPQFVDVDAGHLVLQGFVLGGVQICVSLAVNSVLVVAAGTIALFLARRPAWLRLQRWVTGTLLGAIAVRLAADTSRPAPA